MKYFFLLILFITSLVSCHSTKESKLYEGDIYIKLINFYNVKSIIPKDKLDEFKEAVINFDNSNKTNSEIELNNYYKILIENDLIYKSYFQLKMKNDEIINVYVDDSEYLVLKKELKNLDRDNEKISIMFNGLKISDKIKNKAIYFASTINSVIKTTGKTDWKK